MSHVSCLLSRRRASRRGFTLIELLIVVGISAMLSAIAIGYSSVGRNEVSLSVEATKISQIIFQAQALSISTYGNGVGTCAYGVSFNIPAQTYSLFAYRPTGAPPCPTATHLGGAIAVGDMQTSTLGTSNISISNGVVLWAGPGNDSLGLVMFYPPVPQTFLSHDGTTFLVGGQTLKVYLKTLDGATQQVISVSPAGQVSF